MNKKIEFFDVIIFSLLVIASLIAIMPIGLSLLNSFKTNKELIANVLALPEKFLFTNYVDTFIKMEYLKKLFNTVFLASLSVGGIILVSSLSGWILCRTKTVTSKILLSLFVFSMLIPFNAIMIPLYRISIVLNLIDSLSGLAVIYVGLGCGMAIFMYHAFIKSIPYELEEAAYIDGCSKMQVFTRIIFPLLKPITATIAIMNVLWIWNDFLLPLMHLQSSEKYTLLLSTNSLFGKYTNDWSAILSSLILAVLPVIILYIVLQKYILKGIVDGAVKG